MIRHNKTTRVYCYSNKPGSVSYVLKKHKKELNKIKDFEVLRNRMIEVIAEECPREGTTTNDYLSFLYNKPATRDDLIHWMSRVIEGGNRYKTSSLTYAH